MLLSLPLMNTDDLLCKNTPVRQHQGLNRSNIHFEVIYALDICLLQGMSRALKSLYASWCAREVTLDVKTQT